MSPVTPGLRPSPAEGGRGRSRPGRGRRSLAAVVLAGGVLFPAPARALSVEAFAGVARSSVDTMFFLYLPRRDAAGERASTPFLLFQRARASVGYDFADPGAAGEDAPRFGITTALSWNPAVLRGFAPVVAGQLSTAGPVAKGGVQFARVGARGTVFGWVVSELDAAPTVDVFLLGRLVHPLSPRIGLSGSAEALLAVPTDPAADLALTERARIGLVLGAWQVGPGIELAHVAGATWLTTVDVGGYVRVDL